MKKHIPNMITSMNLLCGVIGVIFTMNARIDLAFIAMLCGALFDFLDGFAARLLGAYSDMGKELDSLSDDITFGLLPSLMLFTTMRACRFSESFLCYIPLLIAAFSALRLAKFNIDERQSCSFLGLPTPACAILCGALSSYVAAEPAGLLAILCGGDVFIPVLSVVLCFLLVCEIPFFGMKFRKDDSAALKSKRLSLLVCGLLCVVITVVSSVSWTFAPLLFFTVYILMNLAFAILKV